MTIVWPLRFRQVGESLVVANEAGSWFRASEQFVERYASGALTKADEEFLHARSDAFEVEGDLQHSAFLYKWALRRTPRSSLTYVILVPTLRCNLACDYCQVSRAAEGAHGYDWSEETLAHTLAFLDSLKTDEVKIEFQGGEPLLRLDLLERVRDFCRTRFKKCSFVVCSNFQVVDDRAWSFFDSIDCHLSTSIDGGHRTHTSQRTHSAEATSQFLANLRRFVETYGSDRVSALPTVDPLDPPDLQELLQTYLSFGFRSIYLRPINRQGFARRRHQADTEMAAWLELHEKFVRLLIEHNSATDEPVEEYYFTHLLRRITRTGADAHVDIRNPSLYATDYVVVDHDGLIYPTDEARMMARVGQIDLSIGSVNTGLDQSKIDQLNSAAFNDFDPDCVHCPYQPFCGSDPIDSISRYGRVDVPRHQTWFCQRQLGAFDLAFELMASDDPKVMQSLAMWSGIGHWPEQYGDLHQ